MEALAQLSLVDVDVDTEAPPRQAKSGNHTTTQHATSATTHKQTLALVLDLHFLQLAGAQFSLQTEWDVADFETALLDATGASVLAERLACDCQPDDRALHGQGKQRLHGKLERAGYTLVLSPSKRVSGAQGSTDVDVAVAVLDVAGAFASEARADVLVLVAGDADFLPCIRRVLSARPRLAVYLVAGSGTMGRSYQAWLQEQSNVRVLNLDSLFGQMAPHVVDLRGAQRPRDARTGRADVPEVLRRLHKAAATAERPLTLNLSGAEGAAWGEVETTQLVQGLFRAARDAADDEADILAQLGELWLHHTQLNDVSCGELAQLISRAVSLREMHVSDTAITLEGVRTLTSAAEAAGCGSGGRHRLYVNARHLSGDEALAVARASSASCTLKLAAFLGKGGGSKGAQGSRGYRGYKGYRGGRGRGRGASRGRAGGDRRSS